MEYKVKSYIIENLGGGTLAYFGELENGLYFSGNEYGTTILKASDRFLYMGEKEYTEEETQAFYKENTLYNFDQFTEQHESIVKAINF